MSYLLVNGFYLFRLKGRATNDERVQNDTDGPGIHFEAVPVCGIEEYLWGNIVRCTADSLLAFARVLDQGSKPEIPDLDIHASVQEQIPKFKVTVDDLVDMHITASSYELYHEEPDLGVGEATPAAQHIHKRTVGTQLESHVDVLFVFETVVKTNDIWVRE